jgi:hypothetical protein
MGVKCRGEAYRGGSVQGLTCDAPEGHAAQDSTCQHTDNLKDPPITEESRRRNSRGGEGGRGEGEMDGGSAQENVLLEV